jgi:hypothetical protein
MAASIGIDNTNGNSARRYYYHSVADETVELSGSCNASASHRAPAPAA